MAAQKIHPPAFLTQPGRTRAAIYARVSTSNNGQDPTMQTRELEEYCQRRGWELTGCYVDDGISGAKESRPKLDRLAYFLNQVGILDHPERYWSGLLRQKFGVKDANPSNLRPGDLVFEENRACWFLLNDKFTIGMVPPEGIMIGEPAKFSSKIIGYGRVPY